MNPLLLFAAMLCSVVGAGCEGRVIGAVGAGVPDDECRLELALAVIPGPSSLAVSEEEAAQVAAAAPKNGQGLPLWESRPGAPVALFLDFDGGTYVSSSSGATDYSAASLDSDPATFNQQEQVAIIRAAMEVAETYALFNVNVTTSDSVRSASERWAWILITNDYGSSGRGKIGAIERRESATALAGTDGVFTPPDSQRGYVLTHELGHNFGLNHNGLWVDGRWVEWSDLEQSRTGAWMGGRNTYFEGYEWMSLQTEDSTDYQDSVDVIASIAGLAQEVEEPTGGDPPTGGEEPPGNDGTNGDTCIGRCGPSCPCDEGEGDCQSNADCLPGLVCTQQSGDDTCGPPPPGCGEGPAPRG